jgi:hypothetical protein
VSTSHPDDRKDPVDREPAQNDAALIDTSRSHPAAVPSERYRPIFSLVASRRTKRP